MQVPRRRRHETKQTISLVLLHRFCLLSVTLECNAKLVEHSFNSFPLSILWKNILDLKKCPISSWMRHKSSFQRVKYKYNKEHFKTIWITEHLKLFWRKRLYCHNDCPFFIKILIQFSRNDHIYSKLDVMQHNIHLVFSVMIIALLSTLVYLQCVGQYEICNSAASHEDCFIGLVSNADESRMLNSLKERGGEDLY